MTDPTFDSLASLPFPLFVSSRHDLILEHYLQPRQPMVAVNPYGEMSRRLWVRRTSARLSARSCIIYSVRLPTASRWSSPRVTCWIYSDPSHAVILRFRRTSSTSSQTKTFCLSVAGSMRTTRGAAAPAEDDPISTAILRARFHSVDEDRATFQRDYRRRSGFISRVQDTESDRLRRAEVRLELRRRWEQVKHEPTRGRAEQAADRPEVFLSYRRKDAEDARRLKNALKRHGIDVWFDECRIKAGDDWPKGDCRCHPEGRLLHGATQRTPSRGGHARGTRRSIWRSSGRSSRGSVKFIYPRSLSENARRLDALERKNIQAQHLLDLNTAAADLARDIKREFAKLNTG